MRKPVNRLELRVVGMSRSGNHAIIDWILAQAPARWCFLNCAEPTHNPFEWARPLGPDLPAHRASFDVDIGAERSGRLSAKDLLLHSYEDVLLHDFAEHEERLTGFVGPSQRRLDVLILRDPYNLFASRRAGGIGVLPVDLVERVWCEHAGEYLGLTRHLPNPTVRINYNAWGSSRTYRRRVAADLGLRFDDAAAMRTPACAGGSSFDGLALDGDAAAMSVFDRWRHCADDPEYHRLLTPRVRSLAAAALPPSAPWSPAPAAESRAA